MSAVEQEREERAGARRRAGWRARVVFAVFSLAGLSTVYGLMVGDLSHPLIGAGDRNLWAYQGYFVATNLSLLPLPHLDLVNDQGFYPYGVSQVFQPWGFERDLMYAGLYSLFGHGPWLQLYFLLSISATLLGCFLLLREEEGEGRAAAFALIAAFGSYAALWRFPAHMGLATLHWVFLGVVADYVLIRRAWENRPWSGRLLLARAAFLLLSLGLDLGYLAGTAITCFVITAPFVVGVVVARGHGSWRERLRAPLDRLRAAFPDLRAHPVQTAGLALLAAVGLLLYLPLVAQITVLAGQFDFSDHPRPYWYVLPLRLLVPILPGIDPNVVNRFMGDRPEGSFGAQPGLFFVIVGIAGAVCAAYRRRLLMYAPFLAALVAFSLLNPFTFRAFNLMPWVSFSRVGSRFTMVFPVLLLLLGLELARALRGRWRIPVALALGTLLAVEATTAYATELRRGPVFVADQGFHAFMAKVAETPGEAVMEWPFCVIGANGIGTDQLCPFMHQQAGLYALRQFHGKKVVGYYLGRLHRTQITPFFEAGWPAMFLPDGVPPRTRRQRRDFVEPEWAFLADFFRFNDFCGLILYPDLLDPGTVTTVRSALGDPAAVTSFPGAGSMEFYPKPASWRDDVDPVRGLRARLRPPDFDHELVLDMTRDTVVPYLVRGWSHADPQWRWTDGSEAEVHFVSIAGVPLLVELVTGGNGNQRMIVQVNDLVLGQVTLDNTTRSFSFVVPATAVGTDNRLRLGLPDANRPGNGDPRVLGASVRSIVVQRIVAADDRDAGATRRPDSQATRPGRQGGGG